VRVRAVAYRWFVEYNPLYFASALCIFAGVFLVARELPPDDFASKLGIAAGTEVYQLLLIGGAGLLLRAGVRRPAAILGLVALLFLLDSALNGERLFSHVRTMSFAPGMRARRALPAGLVLALLGPLKVWMLARVFRLREAWPILVPVGLLVASMPLLPYVIEAAGPLDASRRSAHLAVFWMGAPLFAWGFAKRARAWTSRYAGGVADYLRVGRIADAAPFLSVALFMVHGGAWSTFPGLGLSFAHVAPYLLAAACVAAGRLAIRGSRGAELMAWTGATGALVATAASSPAGVWPVGAVSLMAGASLFGLVWRSGLRLLLPATVCTFGGVYLFAAGAHSPLPLPGPAWPGALALVLLAGAGWHRDFRCLFASGLSAGGALMAINPKADLAPFGLIVLAMWLAFFGWAFFPELRRWLPLAAMSAVLGVGAVMLHQQPCLIAPWYAATAVSALGVGTAFRARPFQGAGLAGFVPLGVEMRPHWVPRTGGGWGLTLLAAGFLLLWVGVIFNLLAARRAEGEGPREVGNDVEA
jgi:hypothetical protein